MTRGAGVHRTMQPSRRASRHVPPFPTTLPALTVGDQVPAGEVGVGLSRAGAGARGGGAAAGRRWHRVDPGGAPGTGPQVHQAADHGGIRLARPAAGGLEEATLVGGVLAQAVLAVAQWRQRPARGRGGAGGRLPGRGGGEQPAPAQRRRCATPRALGLPGAGQLGPGAPCRAAWVVAAGGAAACGVGGWDHGVREFSCGRWQEWGGHSIGGQVMANSPALAPAHLLSSPTTGPESLRTCPWARTICDEVPAPVVCARLHAAGCGSRARGGRIARDHAWVRRWLPPGGLLDPAAACVQ